VSFAAIFLCVASQRVLVVLSLLLLFPYRRSPQTFGYTLVNEICRTLFGKQPQTGEKDFAILLSVHVR
jgi:hypothetical protein